MRATPLDSKQQRGQAQATATLSLGAQQGIRRAPSQRAGEPGCSHQLREPHKEADEHTSPLRQASTDRVQRRGGPAPPGAAAPRCGQGRAHFSGTVRGAGAPVTRPPGRSRIRLPPPSPGGGQRLHRASA
ncbi:hypothetical protein NDU88_002299 [Pleurodeles waltl]|uniref:Uncharacterized protein n=1 Tax=Pleurodeles waltl TaxID=8319 RepID=A0AAV7RCY6_PLEWA|nr:hypothetical protein NDU88_002299 [Pleurodeles waltl]